MFLIVVYFQVVYRLQVLSEVKQQTQPLQPIQFPFKIVSWVTLCIPTNPAAGRCTFSPFAYVLTTNYTFAENMPVTTCNLIQ